MIWLGLTIILLGFIAAFCVGLAIERISYWRFIISFFILSFLYIFGVVSISDGVEYSTLLEYENGKIGYKVTEINVESGKATSIEVIHEEVKNENK